MLNTIDMKIRLFATKESPTQRQRGFTLLELLVVISIIGILIAMGAVAFSTAQVTARDSRRRADIKSWQDALEQTYSKYTSYTGGGSGCTISVNENMNGITPDDPKPDRDYTASCADATYCLCAQLERDNGNSSDTACSYVSGNSSAYYCLSNLQ